MGTSTAPFSFDYRFHFPDGEQKQLQLELDPATMQLRQTEGSAPAWADLEYEQCPNCPLDPKEHSHCPVARNLEKPINMFAEAFSHSEVELEVITRERRYMVATTLQKAMSALLGIYMVSSGCPILDKLRPMVRFHLPVATLEETKYRAIAMHLVGQYLLHKRGGNPDWGLSDLSRTYDEVQVINKAFVKRLHRAVEQDAGLNAVVVLNYFADFVPFAIDEHELEELEILYSAYLNQ